MFHDKLYSHSHHHHLPQQLQMFVQAVQTTWINWFMP
uniref:Uncharacterized protein n=1 Tax=Ciona intestinalis TaxID=7719 RepID=H2XNS8_CIOIN